MPKPTVIDRQCSTVTSDQTGATKRGSTPRWCRTGSPSLRRPSCSAVAMGVAVSVSGWPPAPGRPRRARRRRRHPPLRAGRSSGVALTSRLDRRRPHPGPARFPMRPTASNWRLVAVAHGGSRVARTWERGRPETMKPQVRRGLTCGFGWWPGAGSNRRPSDFQSDWVAGGRAHDRRHRGLWPSELVVVSQRPCRHSHHQALRAEKRFPKRLDPLVPRSRRDPIDASDCGQRSRRSGHVRRYPTGGATAAVGQRGG